NVHPLSVSGYVGKLFYRDDREVDDHVFVTFKFPGKNYFADPEHKHVKDKNDIVVVTYSSISTNSFEPYGECVMGTQGTMLVQSEQAVMLWPEKGGPPGAGRLATMTVSTGGGGKPAVDSTSTSGPAEGAKA